MSWFPGKVSRDEQRPSRVFGVPYNFPSEERPSKEVSDRPNQTLHLSLSLTTFTPSGTVH